MFCRFPYRIPFSETDAMAIVHHSNHAKYLERGRVEFLRLIGLDYLAMTKNGMHFPLTEMHCKFRRPLVFDDIIMVETKIEKLSKTRLTFSYKIFKQEQLDGASMSLAPIEGKEYVSGSTEHCCVNNEGRPQEMSDAVYQKLNAFYSGQKNDHD